MTDLLDAFSRFMVYLLNRWKQGLLLMVLGAGLAMVYALMQPPKYEGRVTFILEEKSGSIGGGLSGIASQFGIDLGGISGGAGMFSGDNILDILVSRSIMEKVLLTKIDSASGIQSPTLADLLLNISGLKNKLDKKKATAALSYSSLTETTRHSMLQDSVLFLMYEKLVKKYVVVERLNKKGSIIKITTVSPDPVFSKTFAERLLDETRKLYVEVKTGISAANVARLEKRADSLLRIMNAKSYQSASMQVLDANAAYKTAIVPAETTQRDRMVTYAIYTEVMKNLEASKMAVANQTPVVQLLDVSKYPLTDQRKSILLLLVAGAIAGWFLFAGWAFISFPTGKNDAEV